MRWYQRFFRRELAETQLDDELRFHLEKQIEQNIVQGMGSEEARYAALRQFGGVEQVKEECRQVGFSHVIETLVQDIRYGLRQLRRNPGFTIVAIVTLALGIGATTAIFSVVEGVLLAPLPYRQPDRLVMVWEWNPQLKNVMAISYPNFLDWQHDALSFDGMAAFAWQGFNLTSPGTPAHLNGMEISTGAFATLGVKLAVGREFTPQEDRQGGEPVAIISNRLWESRYSGSPEVLGKLVTLDDVDHTIVGVLPAGFNLFGNPDILTPLGQGDLTIRGERGSHAAMVAIARLKADLSLHQAQAEMSAVQERLDQLYPNADRGLGVRVVPLKQQIVGNVGRTLFLLLGAVVLVLLIAGANVANLLLARFAARTHEFAIRSALGASRAHLAMQMLIESTVLSLAGGGFGLLIAAFGVKPVLAVVPGSLPRGGNIGLNIPVLLFAFVIAVAVGIVFGLAPALKSSRADLQVPLREGSRGSTNIHLRTQHILVVVEMVLTMILLVGAGLLFRTIRNLWSVKPGFDTQHVLTFRVGLSPSLSKTPADIRTAYQQLVERIRGIPGVQAADLTFLVPLSRVNNDVPFWIGSERPAAVQTAPQTLVYWTGQDYLKTLEISLLRGRFFTLEDTTKSACVTVIDSVFAHAYFKGMDPIGKTLTFGWSAPWGPCRIVGVVGHVRHWGLGNTGQYTQAQSYLSLSQMPDPWVSLGFPQTSILVRTALDTAAVMPAIRKVVYGVGEGQPVYEIRTMQKIVSESMAGQRFPLILLGAFAGLALLLASVGLYGVISYSVTQRTREIGIRMALGAEKSHVLRMVIRQGLKLALIGVAIGIAGALALARFLSSMLYGVNPTDPLTFIAVSLILITIALVACYIPARRAANVDPMVALRYG
jgi:predicted permease